MDAHTLVDNEGVTIEFQGIELTGIDDNVQDMRYGENYAPVQEHEIISKNGIPFRVYVAHGKKQAIFTFHDMGTNHNSFMGFFNYPHMRVLLKNFTVYHICAPGHHDNAAPLLDDTHREERDSLLTGPDSESQNSNANQIFTIFGQGKGSLVYPSLDVLSELVMDAADHFKVSHFLGFGMGAGSNVLCRTALQHPTRILGLFLINPTCCSQGYFTWFKNRWSDLPALQRGLVNDGILRQLEQHWFGAGQAQNLDICTMYEQHLRNLNLSNVAGYISAFNERTDLGIQRELDITKKEYVRGIQVDCTMVSGAKSVDLCRTMTDMNGRMDPSKTEFCSVENCTGMLMEEDPEKLCSIFLLFLRKQGLVVTTTMEKLREEVIKDRSLQHKELANNELNLNVTDLQTARHRAQQADGGNGLPVDVC